MKNIAKIVRYQVENARYNSSLPSQIEIIKTGVQIFCVCAILNIFMVSLFKTTMFFAILLFFMVSLFKTTRYALLKGILRRKIEHFLKKRKYEKLGLSEMN